ncbi:MAG: polyphenol oxidase family protein [Acidimicrobiia bacterium]|nr:polyphenol oxidase family protein [Acidimicrobiia bacterium]
MALTLLEDLSPLTGLLIRTSECVDGSLRVTEPAFFHNLEQLWPTPADVTWLKQIHGQTIVTVDHPGDHAGVEADGAFTTAVGVTLAVTTADCAPVVMAAADGNARALAVVHAGWRGLLAGIIEKGANSVIAAVPNGRRFAFCGPCIGPDHYEFSPADMAPIVERYSNRVRSRTEAGAPSLDLFAGVEQALDRSGFPAPERPPSTASPSYFSHRSGDSVRRTGRMMTLAQLTLS